MSDADHNDATPDAQSAGRDAESSSPPAKEKKKTLDGIGIRFAPPKAKRDDADPKEKRKSLSDRLRKIAGDAPKISRPSAPSLDEESSEVEDMGNTNRMAPPPVLPILADEDGQDGSDDSEPEARSSEKSAPKSQKSTMLMHAALTREKSPSQEDSAPFEEATQMIDTARLSDESDGDGGEAATQMIDVAKFEKDGKAEAVDEPATEEVDLELDEISDLTEEKEEKENLRAQSYDEEKTEFSFIPPGNTEPPSVYDVEKTEISAGLAESTDVEPPPPVDRSSASVEFPIVEPLSAPTPTPEASRRPAAPIPMAAPTMENPPVAPADDFKGENTEIFNSPFENDPICPRLTTLEGPCAGQEFLINRMRNSVGRATNNTVVIPDLSMSRKHFEIFQQADESYAVKDLMAVNGTGLNGVKVREADLFHGDRIEAGESIFQFLIPGEAPVDNRQRRLIPAVATSTMTARRPGDLSTSTRKPLERRGLNLDRLLLTVTIVAALLCVPLLGFLVYHLSTDEASVSVDDASAPDLYFAGVEAIQSRQWDRAQALFEQSYEVDPDFGDVTQQLARIERERRAGALIAEARGYDVARINPDVLEGLRDISRESAYHEDAQSLLRLVRHDEAHALFDRAQRAFDEGDIETSAAALSELQAIAPQHEGGRQLEAAINESIEFQREEEQEMARQAAQANRTASQTSRSTRQNTTRTASTTTAPDPLDPFADRSGSSSQQRPRDSGVVVNFTDGFALYRAENFAEAIAHFETIAEASSGAIAQRAESAAADVRQFRDALAAGDRDLQANRLGDARAHFQRARRADESVAGGTGYFDDTLSERVASTFAREGLQELEAENFASAFDFLTRAQAHHSRESSTRQLARGLEERANSLYIRAVDASRSDPGGAAALCRTILTMVPPSSDIHSRARQLLDEID